MHKEEKIICWMCLKQRQQLYRANKLSQGERTKRFRIQGNQLFRYLESQSHSIRI